MGHGLTIQARLGRPRTTKASTFLPYIPPGEFMASGAHPRPKRRWTWDKRESHSRSLQCLVNTSPDPSLNEISSLCQDKSLDLAQSGAISLGRG